MGIADAINGGLSGYASSGSLWGAAAGAIGGLMGGGTSSAQKQANWWNFEELPRIQKDLAYNGIFHRVQDAKQSGIHPLFALGFQPSNSPSHVIGEPSGKDQGGIDGQNIGRAVNAFLTQDERAMQKRVAELQLEGAELDNQFKRSQIATMTQGQANPALPRGSAPIAGQGDSYIDNPAEQTMGMKNGRAHGEGGAITDVGYSRTSNTRLDLVMSDQMKQRSEDDIFQQMKWHGRHSVPLLKDWNHNFGKFRPPYPDVPVPQGYKKWVWAYDHWKASKR